MLLAIGSAPYPSSSQAISRQRFIVAPSSIAALAFGRPVAPVWMDAGAPPAEQLRLRRLQLLDVVDVVGKEDARRFDVADARELWGCWKVCKNLDGTYTSFRDVTAGA